MSAHSGSETRHSATRSSSSTRKGRRAENALRFATAHGIVSGHGPEFSALKNLSKGTRAEPVFSVAKARKHYGRKKITWLMHVSANGTEGELQTVLGLGAPRDAVDSNGRTAIYYAIENNKRDNLRILIEKGAKLNIADDGGWTPLIFAAHENHVDIVNVLIRAGAKINEASDEGMTALHIASKWNHPDIVDALLKAGANRGLHSESGQTPFDLAKSDRVRGLLTKLTKGGRRTRKVKRRA